MTPHSQLTRHVSKNINQSLVVIQILAKLTGVAPIEWQPKTKRFKFFFNNINILRTVPLMVLYTFLVFYSTYKVIEDDINFPTLGKIMAVVFIILILLMIIFATINGLRNPLKNFFSGLVECDVVLLKNNTKLGRSYYRKIYFYSTYTHVYMLAMITIRHILFYGVFNFDMVLKLSFAAAMFGKSYVKYTVTVMITQIKQRMDKLNSNIRSMYTSSDFKHLAYLDVKTTKEITDKLYHLCRMHYKLCHLMRELNKTFTFQLLCSLAGSMADILFQSYYLYHIVFNNVSNITVTMLASPIVWLVDETVEIYLLVHACASTCESANSTAVYLHEFRNELFNMEIESHIQMYSLQLLHQRIHVSALGFFDIDYSLIYSIIGAVTTYLVIFIQFDQSSSDLKTDSAVGMNNCKPKT